MDEDHEVVKRRLTKSPWDTKKFARLKSLECFPEVYKLLTQGYAASQVSAIIQNQHGEYSDIRHESLTNMLRDFYESEIPSVEKVAHQLPAKFDETVRDYEERVDVLKEYTSLFKIQRERIDTAVKLEKESGVLMKNVGRELKTAAELLDRVRDTQNQSGMTPRHLDELHQSAGLAMKMGAITGGNGTAIMDASKRNQILEFLGQLKSTDPRLVEAAIKTASSPVDVIDIEGDDAD